MTCDINITYVHTWQDILTFRSRLFQQFSCSSRFASEIVLNEFQTGHRSPTVSCSRTSDKQHAKTGTVLALFYLFFELHCLTVYEGSKEGVGCGKKKDNEGMRGFILRFMPWISIWLLKFLYGLSSCPRRGCSFAFAPKCLSFAYLSRPWNRSFAGA